MLQETDLLHRIERLEGQINSAQDKESTTLNKTLATVKMDLEKLIAHQAQGAFIRAHTRYQMEGEKATKLFCSMEKQNSVRKYNSKLNVEHDGISAVITEQKDIEKETQRYYQELFKGQDDQLEIGTIEDFLEDDLAIQCPKLSNAQKSSLERDIDLKELTWYLKNTKANTSPGSSGFSNEFFKFFWRDLKTFIIKYINFSFQTGMLSVSQRLGIITVIPKGDKDKTFWKNWRNRGNVQ